MRDTCWFVRWRTWESPDGDEAFDKVEKKEFGTLGHAKAWLKRELKNPRSNLYRLEECTYSGGENHYKLIQEVKT